MKRNLVLGATMLMSIVLWACGTQNSGMPEVVNANSADYWIEKAENAHEILMSEQDIEALNEAMMSQWGTDWYSGYYNVLAFPETVEKNWLEQRICYLELRNSTLYLDGEAVTTEQWDVYYANLNLEGITSEVSYAVIVKNIAAYDLPTTDVLSSSAETGSSNSLQQTTLKINEPVVVLHESSDGEWLYVVSNEYIGWVEESSCAYFEDYEKWMDFQNNKEFIMVYKDTVLEENNQALYMGTKMYLAKDGEYEKEHMSEDYDYVLRIPQKGADGYLEYVYVGVATEENLCEGYLPYTRENIIKLAFQELGEPYGWGGANGDRDCSMYVKDIYSCFGIKMPRNSRLQMAVPTYGESLSGKTEADIVTRMERACMGDVLGISGHVMLYLGEANDQHYVISMLSSYVPETVTENFGEYVEAVNKVQVNTLDVRRRNGNTWLQELLSIVNIESDNKQ